MAVTVDPVPLVPLFLSPLCPSSGPQTPSRLPAPVTPSQTARILAPGLASLVTPHQLPIRWMGAAVAVVDMLDLAGAPGYVAVVGLGMTRCSANLCVALSATWHVPSILPRTCLPVHLAGWLCCPQSYPTGLAAALPVLKRRSRNRKAALKRQACMRSRSQARCTG